MSSTIPDPPIPNAPWVQSPITIAPCLQSPTIDGKLTDSCWPLATHAVGFYRFFGTAPVAQQTEAWVCADKDHLYIAFHCHDDHPEMIKATEVKRDGDIGNDDFVTVEIDSQNTRHATSVFQVSARGTQSESIEGGTADNITWAGDWKAATQRVPDGWTTEIAIPFALLHYSRNTHAFGLFLKRKLARESSEEGWPYIPHDLQDHTNAILNGVSRHCTTILCPTCNLSALCPGHGRRDVNRPCWHGYQISPHNDDDGGCDDLSRLQDRRTRRHGNRLFLYRKVSV